MLKLSLKGPFLGSSIKSNILFCVVDISVSWSLGSSNVCRAFEEISIFAHSCHQPK